MNKFLKYTFAAFSMAIVSTGCSDFGDTNVDPEHMNETNLPYEMMFTNAQHQALGSDWDVWRNGLIYCGQWMNHVASINQWWTYSLYRWSDGYSAAYWETYHSDRGAVRDITVVLDSWKDDPQNVLNYNIARIMRVFIMHRMTDLYGDIPYSEAGRYNQFLYPKYDKQSDIYKDMLKELDEAQEALKNGGEAPMKSQDLFFQGNTESWRKFANSLMLRLAMRLVKLSDTGGINIAEYVNKAVNNGLVTADVVLKHNDGVVGNDSAEPYAKIFVNGESVANFFLHENFINKLKDDPRLPLIASIYKDNPDKGINDKDYNGRGDSDVAKQKGLPGGASNSSDSDWFIGKKQGYENFKRDPAKYPATEEGDKAYGDYLSKGYMKEYSLPNRYTYSDPMAPTFVLTVAQTKFLVAEAILRGYITSGDASSYYEDGVKAAIKQFESSFPKVEARDLYNAEVTDTKIQNYISGRNFDALNYDGKMQELAYQYWVNCFCNEYEAFANWRRTGYPDFIKSNYDPANPYNLTDTENGTIPRRFRYPTEESQVNTDNYNEAVKRMSKGDKFDSRVWWDAE